MELQPVHVFLITLLLSIPILSIFAGLAKEWLTLRGKQAASANAREVERKLERLLDRAGLQLKNLEKVNQELDEKLKRLEITNEEYAERLENLEAVVVSQAWNALHGPKVSGETRTPKVSAPDGEDTILPTRSHEVSTPTVEEQNRRRAADLARRAGG